MGDSVPSVRRCEWCDAVVIYLFDQGRWIHDAPQGHDAVVFGETPKRAEEKTHG